MRDYIIIYVKGNFVASTGVVTGDMVGWLEYSSAHSKKSVRDLWAGRYGEQLVDVVLINDCGVHCCESVKS